MFRYVPFSQDRTTIEYIYKFPQAHGAPLGTGESSCLYKTLLTHVRGFFAEVKNKGLCPHCMWRQTISCTADGRNREPHQDKSCCTPLESGWSGFCDCNGNNVKDAGEIGYGCSSSPTTCDEVCSCDGKCTISHVSHKRAPTKRDPHACTLLLLNMPHPCMMHHWLWCSGT